MTDKILFVCTMARMRSKTAAKILEPHFEVRYAGVSNSADHRLHHSDLEWADQIIVFEKAHRNSIRKRYPEIYAEKKIECFYIEDIYEYMSPMLCMLIEQKINAFYGLKLTLQAVSE